MVSSHSRRQHVVVLTCILAIAPLGVALARWGGAILQSPEKKVAQNRSPTDVKRRAVLDLAQSQYSDRKGAFDIQLPPPTEQVELSTDVVPFNPLASLDDPSYAASGASAAAWSSGPSGGGASMIRPRRGSSSFATTSRGMSGVGAWGGVSGSARRAPGAPVSARPLAARAIAAASQPAANRPPSRPSSSPRSGSGSSSNSGSRGSSSQSDDEEGGVAAGGGATGATGAVAAAVPPAVGGGGAVAAVPPTGAAPGGGGLAPSAAPEPISLVLMGAGLAGLYRTRRYFE